MKNLYSPDMDFSALKDLCEARKSIREFSEKAVEEADIIDLLSVAHLAPSVANTQPWRFHVVKNAGLRSKLIEAVCYGTDIESPPSSLL